MFENGYPYTDLHELNLDWLVHKMKDLEVAMETFKATESLKFADPIIWNITTQYEKSTIVLDPSGNAYLSLKPVPAGVQLNNGEYWLEIFNFTDYTRTANKNLTIHVETDTTRATATYSVDDWLIWNDVLYRVTSAIAIDDAFIVAPSAGANIIHFTVEDFIKAFITYATNLINQYKNDIDASELAYRQQLASDIAQTTSSLQAQLNAAIAGATVDSEVINARVGADNVTYATLGDAIRTQIDDLRIGESVFPECQIFLQNGGLSSANGVEQASANRVRTTFIHISDFVELSTDSSLKTSVFIYDADKTKIASSGWNAWGETFTPDVITSIFSGTDISTGVYYRFLFRTDDTIDVDYVGSHIFYRNKYINRSLSFDDQLQNSVEYQRGGLSATDGSEITSVARARTAHIPFELFGSMTVHNVMISVFAYDSLGVKLNSSQWWGSNDSDTTLTFVDVCNILNLTPDSIKTIRFMFKYSDGSVISDYDVFYNYLTYKSFLYVRPTSSVLHHKKISIYGDSISTYAGWIPEGNDTYYTGSNAGVSDVSQTWWKRLIDTLDLTLLVNNSWSGRAVSSVRDNQAGHQTDAAYKQANVDALASGGISPDIIIIKLGINDFNYNAILGDYDGSSALPTDPTKFLDAYAIMLDEIMTSYPLAEVYCCTLMQCERTGSLGFPEINNNGDSLIKWNEAIRKLAHAFGAKILDHDSCGITYYNLSTYAGDYSAGHGLHPNAAGHALIADVSINQIDNTPRVRYH